MNVHEFTVKSTKSYPDIRDHSGPQPSSIIPGTAFREQKCRQKECKAAVSSCKVTAVLQALTSLKNMEVKYQENPSCDRRFLSAELSRMPSHRRFPFARWTSWSTFWSHLEESSRTLGSWKSRLSRWPPESAVQTLHFSVKETEAQTLS